MAISRIKAQIPGDIKRVWEMMLDIEHYSTWRSDLSKAERVNEKPFVEYTKDGFSTIFSVTNVRPYRRWELDMENRNMKGHWVGVFTARGNQTQIDFTECVEAKKFFMKPFVKCYLKKQQAKFVADIMKKFS